MVNIIVVWESMLEDSHYQERSVLHSTAQDSCLLVVCLYIIRTAQKRKELDHPKDEGKRMFDENM